MTGTTAAAEATASTPGGAESLVHLIGEKRRRIAQYERQLETERRELENLITLAGAAADHGLPMGADQDSNQSLSRAPRIGKKTGTLSIQWRRLLAFAVAEGNQPMGPGDFARLASTLGYVVNRAAAHSRLCFYADRGIVLPVGELFVVSDAAIEEFGFQC